MTIIGFKDTPLKRQELTYSISIYLEAAVVFQNYLKEKHRVRLGKGRGKPSEQSGNAVNLKVMDKKNQRWDR